MPLTILEIQPMKFFPSLEAGSVLVWELNVVLWVNMGFVFLWLLFPTGWLLPPWTDKCFLLKPQRERKPVMWECTPRKIKCWAWLLYLEREAGGTTKRRRKFKQGRDGTESQSVIKMRTDKKETGTRKKKWKEIQRDKEIEREGQKLRSKQRSVLKDRQCPDSRARHMV